MLSAVVDACTIVARNYLPHARVLGESFLEQHPGGSFTVLVVDATETDIPAESFPVVTPYDLGIARAEVHRMAFIYDLKEFATAVKPWLLRRMLEESEHSVYFDPDIEVFAPLDDIRGLALEHGIVLTPHTTKPLPRDNLLPNEEMLLCAGIYNLGFIAVGRQAMPFLDWWADRLRRHCIVDIANGLFVDQRWVDFVPAMFEHEILRDHTCNVAYWNLEQRTLLWSGERYEVDGAPLRFFHYSGFDPYETDRLSAHMGTVPRVLLRDQPAVRRLCDEYGGRLRNHGYGTETVPRYRFDELPNGLAIDPSARRDVREAMLAAESAGENGAPDPFDPPAEPFLDWLAQPGNGSPLPRYLAAMYRRDGSLRQAYPEATSTDVESFVDWACGTRDSLSDVPQAVLSRICHDRPSSTPTGFGRRLVRRYPWLSPLRPVYHTARNWRARLRARDADQPQAVTVPTFPPLPGLNVVGYLDAELGVGEAARRVLAGLARGSVPHTSITYGRTSSRREHPWGSHAQAALFDTNLVCVNADQLAYVRSDMPPELFERRYTIGLWFWEVSTFPRRLHSALNLVDEVWVASDFVAQAIAPHSRKPVHVIPLPIEPGGHHGTRAELGLPEGFLFLFSFDFLSIAERKNPSGLIEAFTRAFAPNEGPILLFKTINGDRCHDSLARLRREASGRTDIIVMDGYLSAAENRALTALCDCYVSLHRSEGYGLTIAEAMVSAKPVIATGYSGNMTFMDAANSFVVPYVLRPIPSGCDPYPAGAEWAAPELDAAAAMMRRVWDTPGLAGAVGRRAQTDIRRRFPTSRTAAFIAGRLNELGPARTRRAEEATAGAGFFPHTERGSRPTALARRALARLLEPYLAEQHELAEFIASQLRSHEFGEDLASDKATPHDERGAKGSRGEGGRRAA